MKGPETGTVHDNGNIMIGCPITPLWIAFLNVLDIFCMIAFCFWERSWSVKFMKLSCTVITLAVVVMLCPYFLVFLVYKLLR